MHTMWPTIRPLLLYTRNLAESSPFGHTIASCTQHPPKLPATTASCIRHTPFDLVRLRNPIPIHLGSGTHH
jgi:hypothetical protein